MAWLVYGLNQSLDGYVDHTQFAPDDVLFRHFIDEVSGQAACLYGRKTYDLMRYWEDDHPDWERDGAAFAAAWRAQDKRVVSRGAPDLGPNASLLTGDLEAAIRALKSELDGEVGVTGPDIARSLIRLDLIDEYRVYLHPVVLGGGTPFFAEARPRLRLDSMTRIGADVVQLSYLRA